MKVRNGFVSNSSSSSFILMTPRNEKIPLDKMEEYVGGYTDALDEHTKGILTYLLWESQYSKIQDESDSSSREEFVDGEMEENIYCSATWEEKREVFGCRGLYDGVYTSCERCKYLRKESRPKRNDDYYEVKEYNDYPSIIEDKNIYKIYISDSYPPCSIGVDAAYKIRENSGYIFKNHENIIEGIN